MPADLSISEIAFYGLLAVGAVVGLFRGLSGGLGTLGGLAAAIAVGWYLIDPVSSFIAGREWFEQPMATRAVALVVDGVIGLIVFGLVRRLIEKFVRFLVPRTLDAVLGAVAGSAAAFALWRVGEWMLEFYKGNSDAIGGAVLGSGLV